MAPGLAVCVLRYEDMLAQPERAFGRAAQAAGGAGVLQDGVLPLLLHRSELRGRLDALDGGLLSAGTIQPGQGQGMELEAIAACVIGGVALSGGRGSILGIFLGAALIILYFMVFPQLR